jgi:hypothetical protein
MLPIQNFESPTPNRTNMLTIRNFESPTQLNEDMHVDIKGRFNKKFEIMQEQYDFLEKKCSFLSPHDLWSVELVSCEYSEIQ